MTLESDLYTSNLLLVAPAQCYVSTKVEVLRLSYVEKNGTGAQTDGCNEMSQIPPFSVCLCLVGRDYMRPTYRDGLVIARDEKVPV